MDRLIYWIPVILLIGAIPLFLIFSLALAVKARRMSGVLFWFSSLFSTILGNVMAFLLTLLLMWFKFSWANILWGVLTLFCFLPFAVMTYEGHAQKSRSLFWAGILGNAAQLLFWAVFAFLAVMHG